MTLWIIQIRRYCTINMDLIKYAFMHEIWRFLNILLNNFDDDALIEFVCIKWAAILCSLPCNASLTAGDYIRNANKSLHVRGLIEWCNAFLISAKVLKLSFNYDPIVHNNNININSSTSLRFLKFMTWNFH